MTVIYNQLPLGNTTSSTGLNDCLIGSVLNYHNSFSTHLNKLIPYYIEHTTLNEWEYGLGIIIQNTPSEIVLVRGDSTIYPETTIYFSSNNNQKVSFSAGTKQIKSVIPSEQINKGGINFSYKDESFTADTVYTVYGVLADSEDIDIILPSGSGNPNLVLGFRNLNSSSYNLNIIPSGSDTIDGANSTTITPTERYASFISHSSGWYELTPQIDVSAAGTPGGSVGAIQYKEDSLNFGAEDALFWNEQDNILLIGNSGLLTANIILPGNLGQSVVINNNQHNNDFLVYGTGSLLYYDASSGKLGVNTSSDDPAWRPETVLHLVGRCANDTMRLESSTTCPTGVALSLVHNPADGLSAGDRPATINLKGRDSNGELVNFGQITTKVISAEHNYTSGELIFNVNYNGIDTNVFSVHPKKLLLGLGSESLQQDNSIVIGNMSKDSGTYNFIVGNDATIIGTTSDNNMIFGNDAYTRGSDNLIIGNNITVSGNAIYNVGLRNYVSGESNFVLGSGNQCVSEYSYIFGNNNSSTKDKNNFIIGDSIISSNISGYIVGFVNNISGTYNTINGNNIYATGSLNTVLGRYNSVLGDNNDTLGDNNNIIGDNNVVFGDQLDLQGSGCVIIGRNAFAYGNNMVVISNDDTNISIANNNFVYNSGTNDGSTFYVYGNDLASGLFASGNKLGINKIPETDLDVNGIITTTGIYTSGFKLYSSSPINNLDLLVSDTNGNASWTSLSGVQSVITSNFPSNGVIRISNGVFDSASGIYSSATSGLYVGAGSSVAESFFLASTGTSVIINNTGIAAVNAFNIKNYNKTDLLTANASISGIGINTSAASSYSLNVLGKSRFFNGDNTTNYFEKDTDGVIIGYTSNNYAAFRSSGVFFYQQIEGQIIPAALSSSTPSSNDLSNIKIMTIHYTNGAYQFKHLDKIYGGFNTFNGDRLE